MANTLVAMKEAGYQVEALGPEFFTETMHRTLRAFYDGGEKGRLVEEGLADLLPLAEYERWLAGQPEPVRRRIDEHWGPAAESSMLIERDGQSHFVIPRIASGNLLLLPQPPRSEDGRDEQALYHDTAAPVSHHYLATYLYLRKQFGAHALVHFGTHGTQEWTPGKERGLSVHEDPYLAVGDLPVLYPYITNNLAEGIQARRRGRATLISHQTPPFAVTGTYGELSEIQRLIQEYGSDAVAAVKESAKDRLLEKVLGEGIHADMGWDEQALRERTDAFVAELNDYLLGLSGQAQPLGMHSFGTYPRREHLVSTLALMLGTEFREAADGPDALAARDYRSFKDSRAFRLIETHVLADEDLAEVEDEALREHLELGRDYARRFRDQREIEGLLDGLAGRFITTSVGGDPVRSPESLPTGRNLYAFDPSKVPTRAAWETGKRLLEQTIADFRAQEGRMPEKLTFNLWSLETMRHLGVMEAQALWAMGVRPIWDRFDRVTGIEVVEASELGRPRIDVVVSATGLYRDTFPNCMKRIAEAADRIGRMKEEDNFAYRHAQALRESLLAQGMAADEAERLSTIRVFSNPVGDYGSGLEDTALASDTWDQDGKLAENFLRTMGHYYGADDAAWGIRGDGLDLFARNLSGTDSVVFSRTSNLYGLLTSDDPFGFFGGLALAVRHLDGESPPTLIANLRDPDNARNETTGSFLAKELRGRYFHPQWVQAMQEEGYAGTLGVLDVVNNFWGWQVVDPEVVRDDQWQGFVDVYVNDSLELGVRDWFEENNPQALAQIAERMLEAVRKDYWQAEEATVKQLAELYADLRERHAAVSPNERFNEFLAARLQGYGLSEAAPDPDPTPSPAPASAGAELEAAPAPVRGQHLEPVDAAAADAVRSWFLWLLAIVLITALGYLRQRYAAAPARLAGL